MTDPGLPEARGGCSHGAIAEGIRRTWEESYLPLCGFACLEGHHHRYPPPSLYILPWVRHPSSHTTAQEFYKLLYKFRSKVCSLRDAVSLGPAHTVVLKPAVYADSVGHRATADLC